MSDSSPAYRALRILVVDDEENVRFALQMCLENEGHRVITQSTISSALDELARRAFDLIFLDMRLGTDNGLDYLPRIIQENPWSRVVVITAYASIETAVEAMKCGASDYLSKPFDYIQLQLLTRKVAERRVIERKMEALQRTLGSMDAEWDFPTISPLWSESLELAKRVAASHSTVLIRGELGTGRGRLARAMHEWSFRSQGPFVAVSLMGKSVDAVDTELFGGDSPQAPGAIALAHGGTLLLDEVAEMPLRPQMRLLGLIRENRAESPDAATARLMDVRVIATTSADLDAAVVAGTFRHDLRTALGVIQIDVPALRDRIEDMPVLANRYLAHFARGRLKANLGFSKDAMFVLRAHAWSGNIVELKYVVERAVLACDGSQIELEHLPPDLLNASTRNPKAVKPGYELGDLVPLEVIEENHIRKVLASAKTIRRAASILGINASTLCRKLSRFRGDVALDDESTE